MSIYRNSLAIALLIGSLSSAAHAAEGAPGTEPSALVRVAPLSHHTLTDTLTGYGVVTAATGQQSDIALPRGGRLLQLKVSAGQRVISGAPLFTFQTGAADTLAYRQANSAAALARDDLKRSEELFAGKLITASQLAAARKALHDAEAALQAQRAIGASRGRETITAPFDGVIGTVQAAQGDYLAAGAPVMTLLAASQQQVQLGIEPEEIKQIAVGMPVQVVSVFDESDRVSAPVTAVHGTVNPQTRLVDVTVALTGTAAHFLPGTRVRGDIAVQTANVTAVPRSAVLRDGDGAFLYQVKDGRAVRVAVSTGIESGVLVAVDGALDPALPVVVQGNYELEDGMAVREGEQ